MLFSSTTLLSKTSRILNYFKTTPKLPLSSHNLHSPYTDATKRKVTFSSEAHLKLITNPVLFSALAHVAKLAPSFSTLAGYRELNEPLGSRNSLLVYLYLCITCTFCKKLYIRETGRGLGDRFGEHLLDVEKDDKAASKPVALHFNLPQHSTSHMAVCSLSLLNGCTESHKKSGAEIHFSNPHGVNQCSI